ncbi:AMIN-like domain-containing (lipo)protein [Planomonospora parontospora]|uniref:AMIN-like domain-containing (lipo)protein n=1 Tax=Planomonospora parontospora TaxID=58119 RepID=UPI00166FBC0C|nr:hypothetical protein [Planomonospora parontospora]GGL05118.1 hypothetical protein GCM10014719_04180 [Planomonospora parontospora subsp. antibiotica]GII14361.1 hypothetical protein Ppa05_10870 [Planomonospora parontospora subsp. antibiotica]
MNRSRAALVIIPLVLLAGCGGSTGRTDPAGRATGVTGSPSSGVASTAGTGSVPPTAQDPPGTQDPSGGRTPGRTSAPQAPPTGPEPPTSTGAVRVERNLDEPPLVTGVRFAEHAGYDRVVIDFRGDLPGYTVDWVPELVQDGSGEPIDVEGGAYLQVTMLPANAHTEEGTPTLTGGPILQAGLGNVRSVVKTGDFEAVVGVGIVLERRAGFRVTEQKQPNRLVIDVAH